MKIRDFLKNPAQWTKYAWARVTNTPKGANIYPQSIHATCWCLDGLLMKCYTDVNERLSVESKINQYGYMHQLPGFHFDGQQYYGLISYNDRPETTFEDIRRIVEECDV